MNRRIKSHSPGRRITVFVGLGEGRHFGRNVVHVGAWLSRRTIASEERAIGRRPLCRHPSSAKVRHRAEMEGLESHQTCLDPRRRAATMSTSAESNGGIGCGEAVERSAVGGSEAEGQRKGDPNSTAHLAT